MPTLLLINGPNLNKLGSRNQQLYGSKKLAEIENELITKGEALGLSIKTFQSNHEGQLIDFIQQEAQNAIGIIINPGGLAHTSVVLRDALVDANLPTVEVHISNIYDREEFRRKSITEIGDIKSIVGQGWQGYFQALNLLSDQINHE